MNRRAEPIIHYDLKPANIIYHRGQVKVTDFGLSKIIRRAGEISPNAVAPVTTNFENIEEKIERLNSRDKEIVAKGIERLREPEMIPIETLLNQAEAERNERNENEAESSAGSSEEDCDLNGSFGEGVNSNEQKKNDLIQTQKHNMATQKTKCQGQISSMKDVVMEDDKV